MTLIDLEPCQLYIGISDPIKHGSWLRLSNRSKSLYVVYDADRKGASFGRRIQLDIEIIGSSFVAMKYGVTPPAEEAGSFRSLDENIFPPVVVVPPALSPEKWPEELPIWTDDRGETSAAYMDAHGYEVSIFCWTKVLDKVAQLKRDEPSLRAGLHTDTIGYFNLTDKQQTSAFEIAYADYCKKLAENPKK